MLLSEVPDRTAIGNNFLTCVLVEMGLLEGSECRESRDPVVQLQKITQCIGAGEDDIVEIVLGASRLTTCQGPDCVCPLNWTGAALWVWVGSMDLITPRKDIFRDITGRSTHLLKASSDDDWMSSL
ncbi:unnamed protein product [Caretta caretta]